MKTPILPKMKGIQRIGRIGYLRPIGGEYDAFTVQHLPLGHFVTFTDAAKAVEQSATTPTTKEMRA